MRLVSLSNIFTNRYLNFLLFSNHDHDTLNNWLELPYLDSYNDHLSLILNYTSDQQYSYFQMFEYIKMVRQVWYIWPYHLLWPHLMWECLLESKQIFDERSSNTDKLHGVLPSQRTDRETGAVKVAFGIYQIV